MTLVSSVSGTAKSLPIDDVDLVMLEYLCVDDSVFSSLETYIAQIVRHPIIEKGYPSIDEANLRQRIQHYIDAGVMQKEPTYDPAIIAPKRIHELRCDAHRIALEDELRMGTHAAISLHSSGMCFWSSTAQEFVKITALEAALITAFCNSKAVSSVVSEKAYLGLNNTSLLNLVGQLKALGILADKKETLENNTAQANPFYAQTDQTRVGNDWKTLAPNGRTPVYFVPHMENHLPLALGVLYSSLAQHKDGALLEHYQLVPLNYLSPKDFIFGPYRKFGVGIWLFSNYMWSIDVNMQVSDAVKQHNPSNFTIHGGPSTPDYEQACIDFMNENASVDIAVHGEGEITITEVFESLSANKNVGVTINAHKMSSVAGLTYRDPLTKGLVRTSTRERMKQPDEVPSPYLSGLFDGYGGRVEAAIIETNRGCPYGCTFCDWGSATNQKIRKFDMARVEEEITWIGKNNIRVLWIADANFGLYDRDIDISRYIIETKQKYGYPQEIVVNYTKNATWRLVEIIKIFSEGGIIGQGIISIQTTDEKTLEVIDRKNIRTQRYDELAKAFTDLNLPLSTDLMIGLPGMTVDSFLNDLQRYIDMDISVKAYPTQLLPNSPMAAPEYLQKYKIQADEHGYLTSTFSYSETDLRTMLYINEIYMMAEGYGLLRYIIRYLQWDHGINAKRFFTDILDNVQSYPDRYPLITWAVHFFNKDKSMPRGWQPFFEQVKLFIKDNYNIENDSGLETVLKVNAAAMPDDALTYPVSIEVEHDFVSYFQRQKLAQDKREKLTTCTSSSIQFADPNKLATIDLEAAQYDSHQYFYELHSAVARPKSI